MDILIDKIIKLVREIVAITDEERDKKDLILAMLYVLKEKINETKQR